jgi:hypothetical protein
MVDSNVRREVAPIRLRDPGTAEATVYRIQHYDHRWKKTWAFSDITHFGNFLDLRPYHDCWQITGEHGFLDPKLALKTLRKIKAVIKDERWRSHWGRQVFSEVKQWRVVKVRTIVEISVVKRQRSETTDQY